MNQKNRFTIRQLYRDGTAVLEFRNGYQRGTTIRGNIETLAPRERCAQGFCEGTLAIGRNSHNVLTVTESYASGDLVVRFEFGYQRGTETTALAQNLEREVPCLGQACAGDEAIGRTSGNLYRILHLFEAGSVQVEHLSGYQRGTVTHAQLNNLAVRVGSRPHHGGGGVIVTPPYDGGGGNGSVVVTPRDGVSCFRSACQVGLACIDGCPRGARCNRVEARGIDRILSCMR